ncbi:MAG: elongation factor 4 [Chitinophagaceae bacterium]|nr:MAG: elongation factor 4 [Chitinophagaceae bacterium]
MKNIRNFCIIAHIDHGKSTLADRLLQTTNTITKREFQNQVLDSMDLERERGITIKSHAIQMDYIQDGEHYTLNLIDTPGHVDFSYEVSRAIAACEGALLLIDATQGVQAQTISNLYMALEYDLEIIPIINKIDMPGAMLDEVEDQIIDLLGCEREAIVHASGKTGEGVDKILKQIISEISCPKGDPNEPLQAMIFDSFFNIYRGVVAYFRIMNGTLKKGDPIKFLSTGKTYEAEEVGILRLQQIPKKELHTGDVGYVITGIKESKEVKVGDTITHVKNPTLNPVRGFQEVKPMVFAGIYPTDSEDFEDLRDALERLQLNDASLTYEPETSAALGFGFRCGFLGLLHLEIIQERLEREFDMSVITTVPNVSYRAFLKNGKEIKLNNPSDMPSPELIEKIEEPYIKAQIITKPEYLGNLMSLCIDKRGILKNQVYLTTTRVEITFEMPLAEIVFDFYDKLKSVSKGYASFDYFLIEYREGDLVRLDVKLNGENVDALSALIHKDKAYDFGRRLCSKLKDLIDRQQFMIAIQAAIGNKIIARETISALRKDVTSKCYGGDITRKRKLLEKQKKGKKKMRQIGSVEVPQQAFLAVLKLDD